MGHKTLLLAVVIIAVGVTLAIPRKRQNNGQVDPSNLMFTFDRPEDVPSAFFEDNAPRGTTEKNVQSNNNKSPQPRRIYPGCQDGSGGLCVSRGECPSHLKPERDNRGACKLNQECCYGPPVSDTSCGSRGGECRSVESCGRFTPKVQGTECDGNSQVCCILIF